MIVRRECWTLSSRGKLLAVLLLLALSFLFVKTIHPFLAVTERVDAEILVIEGWVPSFAFPEAVNEFKRGAYKRILTAGTVTKDGWLSEPQKTEAHHSASWLQRLGLTNDVVTAVPCYVWNKDRTYHSALAVKRWLQENAMEVKSINVLTLGSHARRSWLLYEKAFGGTVRVGVISVNDRTYDPDHWWRSSAGVRELIGEVIAYIYARVVFTPDGEGPSS